MIRLDQRESGSKAVVCHILSWQRQRRSLRKALLQGHVEIASQKAL